MDNNINTNEELRARIEELEQQKEFYQTIVDNTYDWEDFRDDNGRITYINKAFERITGYKCDDILNSSISYKEIVHPDDYSFVEEAVIQSMNQIPITDLEFRIIRSDNQIRFINLCAQPVWKNDEYIGTRSSARDITEQKDFIKLAKMNTELTKSQLKFQNYIQSSPTSVFLVNEKGQYKFVNPSACKLLGYSESELLKLSFPEITPQNQLNEAIELFNQLQKSGEIHNFDTQLVHKDGTLVDIILDGKKLSETEFIAYVKDITFIKQSEHKLLIQNEEYAALNAEYKTINEDLRIALEKVEESEVKLKLMYEHTSIGIAISTLDFKVTQANPAFCKMIGYTEDEFIGKTLWDYTHPEVLEQNILKLKELMSGRIPYFQLEKRYIHKDGHTVNGLLNATIIRDSQGNAKYFLGNVQDITELKKAELELKENRTLLNLVLDTIPQSVFWKDKSSVYLGCNKAFANSAGLEEPNMIIGKTDFDLPWTEEEAEAYRKDDFEVFNTNTPKYHIVEPIHQADGSMLWIDTSKVVLKNDKGEPFAVLGIFSDMTAQKQAEIDLIKNEEKYKALVDNAFEGICIVTLEGLILFANKALYKLLEDHEENKLVGRNVFEFIAPESQGKALEDFVNVTHGIDSYISEYCGFTTKGNEIWFESIGKLITYNDGIADIVSIRDVTERKKAEKEILLQSELRQLLMEISTEYINLPLNNMNTEINKSLKKLAKFVRADRSYIFDFDTETGLCSNAYEWCQEGIIPQIDNLQNVPLAQEWIDAFRLGKPMYVPDVSALPDGFAKEMLEPQHIKSLISVPMMSSGVCIGFIGFDSVSDYHSYSYEEQQLLSVFAEILVNINLRQRIETEIIASKEKAEESDRLKTAFLANMSHEIRTPMNGVLGFMNLLKEPNLSEEEKNEYIGIVNSSGQRLLDTINDIIEISNLEAGQATAQLSVLNIHDVLSFYYDFFELQTFEKDIDLKLSINIPSQMALIKTDRHKLDGIITNLIKNAIKFTPSGTIEFGCSLVNDDIEFFVTDTGMGIPNDRLDAIFERFVQADLQITRPHEGSGLGLAIVKAYTDLLGGKIWVESVFGKGSTFRFTIPYRPSTETTNQSQEIVEICSQQDLRTILIAEDDNTSYKYFENILPKHEFRLLRTKDGMETVEAVRNNHDIAIVLMDIKMPGINGFEATKQIRVFNKFIPIIAQTAYSLAGDKEKALEVGCNDYIAKPIDKGTLLKLIYKYVK